MGLIRILGAGVMGLAIATELVARGHRVELVDPETRPGPHGCSWWAGGMLAPYCEGESAEEPVERLGLGAIDWWDRHAGGVQRRGTLVLAPARDRAELDRFARRSRGHRLLDATGIAALEPDLAGRFTSGLFYADEAHLSPRAALAALHQNLRAQGASFHATPPATTPDHIIDARGLAARDQLPDLRGVRGEMLVLRCPEVSLSRPVRLLHPRHRVYIVPRSPARLLVGASEIESEDRSPVSLRSAVELMAAAHSVLPALAEARIVRLDVNLRPALPDNNPRIVHIRGTLAINGLFRHGWLLAPALVEQALRQTGWALPMTAPTELA